MRSNSCKISANGNVSYLRMWAKVISLRPFSLGESLTTWFRASHVEATYFMLRKWAALGISNRTRFTASSVEVRSLEGSSDKAYITRWVSRRVSSGVESCSTCFG